MLIPGPWKALQILLNLRGNHMTEHVERVNKWAYFAQNIGWIISIPVAITLLYSNLSNRVDAQEKEIVALRAQVDANASDVASHLDKIDKQQQQQMQVLTEVKTIVEGTPHGHFQNSIGN